MVDNDLLTGGIELWFERIFSEIHVLNAEVERKVGILFLNVHTLSEEEISAHPSFEKIRALCGQIDDLYGRWHSNKSIRDDEYEFYKEKRVEVERALGALRVHIVERKPTFLDTILRAFDAIVEFVQERLLRLGDAMLKRLGYNNVPDAYT